MEIKKYNTKPYEFISNIKHRTVCILWRCAGYTEDDLAKAMSCTVRSIRRYKVIIKDKYL